MGKKPRLPLPPNTDTMIFHDHLTWVAPEAIAQDLRPELSLELVEKRLKKCLFPLPFIEENEKRFYRVDFILAYFKVEGKFCTYCLKPLGRRQYFCCSRTCVSRYDQLDETTVKITLPVSGNIALKLFRCAILEGKYPQGLASRLLKDSADPYFKQHGDFLLQFDEDNPDKDEAPSEQEVSQMS